jgi:THO complex subunit 1
MHDTAIASTAAYRSLVRDLLAKAAKVKKGHDVEPPITEASLGDLSERAYLKNGNIQPETSKQTDFAAVETAFREKFYELLVFSSRR